MTLACRSSTGYPPVWRVRKNIRHIRVSLSPRFWPVRFNGIARMRVTAKAQNSWVKCLLRPSHRGVTRYTLTSSPRRLRGSAHTITHSLLKTSGYRHCNSLTLPKQTTGVPARALSSDHRSDVSSTFNRKVEELASSEPRRHAMPHQAPATVKTSPPAASPVIILSASNAPIHTGNSKKPIMSNFGNSKQPIIASYTFL
jgi:hypothetical protein